MLRGSIYSLRLMQGMVITMSNNKPNTMPIVRAKGNASSGLRPTMVVFFFLILRGGGNHKPLNSRHMFLMVLNDNDGFRFSDLTKSIIVEWLERFGEQEGLKVLTLSTVEILAMIIKDFHGRVKIIADESKREHLSAIA